ncbi:hypothetical protein NDU88_001599 [Pleurodeles waltl]|uniref:Uncharacterized protein n=1 Tax=Pleurodeles waltl TaxID=8319 RepID=A0AAV7VA51_PLEWA|nr:hypothetical protein NDU88_001599 [Pleurodeles waltl]
MRQTGTTGSVQAGNRSPPELPLDLLTTTVSLRDLLLLPLWLTLGISEQPSRAFLLATDLRFWVSLLRAAQTFPRALLLATAPRSPSYCAAHVIPRERVRTLRHSAWFPLTTGSFVTISMATD